MHSNTIFGCDGSGGDATVRVCGCVYLGFLFASLAVFSFHRFRSRVSDFAHVPNFDLFLSNPGKTNAHTDHRRDYKHIYIDEHPVNERTRYVQIFFGGFFFRLSFANCPIPQ